MTTREELIGRATVLCVDDERHVLWSLERLLHRFGCRVLLANTGSEALDVLEREHIDVMICDEAMPGISGTEVLREAKTISPDTKRILLTAHCGDEEVVLSAVNDAEIFRLLPKPWKEGDVRRAVGDALGLSVGTTRPTGAPTAPLPLSTEKGGEDNT